MGSVSTDILVIGDGIVGSTAAYELALAGHSVTVIGDGGGASASEGNAGILAISYAKPMSTPESVINGIRSLAGLGHEVEFGRPLSPRTLSWFVRFTIASRPGRAIRSASGIHRMALRSLALYDRLSEREELDLMLRHTGWLYAARTKTALEVQRQAAESLTSLGIGHDVLSPSELRQAEPGLGPGHVGGVFYHDDVAMDPTHLTAQVRTACVRHGVDFHHDRVVSADQERSGRVRAVTTQGGKEHRARHIVLAAGAQSREVGALFRSTLPVEPAFGWNALFRAETALASRLLMSIEDHVIINAAQDSVRVTGGMEFGGTHSTQPQQEQIVALRESAQKLLPALRELGEPVSTWRGARPMTPSGEPIVRHLAPNLSAATGHGTLGMTLAPATAEQVSALVSEILR